MHSKIINDYNPGILKKADDLHPVLKEFQIVFSGLKYGISHFDYQISAPFFEQYPEGEIEKGEIEVDLKLDKRNRFLWLQFDVKGFVEVDCDRCLEKMEQAVQFKKEVIVKFAETIPEYNKEDDTDVVYLNLGEISINIAQVLYEYIVLSLPIKKVHPTDKNGKSLCNPKVLEILEQGLWIEHKDKQNESSGQDLEKDEDPIDPRWAALKALKEKK